MSKKYNLSIEEIVDVLCKFNDEEIKGFDESEIIKTEEKLGIKFPTSYKKYMMLCGKNSINYDFNRMNTLEEITSNFIYLEENIEDEIYHIDKIDDKEKKKKAIEESKFYKFKNIPKERYNELTDEYILIWSENQGCWDAAYLKKDIINQVEDAPVYISTEMDFYTFDDKAETTYDFIKEMLSMSGCGEYVDNHDRIIDFMNEDGLDIDIMCKDGINSCYDTEKDTLYFYYKINECEIFTISYGEYFEDDDECE